jgi:uncharacterized membrane protein YhaH (DUF805 family)
MIVCEACGDWIEDAVRSCPSCGMPNALRPQSGGWLSFRGRISVAEFWLRYMLPIALIGLLGSVLDQITEQDWTFDLTAGAVTVLPSLAGATKRLHDRNRSGWFQLVALIPVVGLVWTIVEIACLSGTPGPNRYGPPPAR